MGSHVGLARQLPLAPVKVVGAIDFISWLDINFVCGDRALLKGGFFGAVACTGGSAVAQLAAWC